MYGRRHRDGPQRASGVQVLILNRDSKSHKRAGMLVQVSFDRGYCSLIRRGGLCHRTVFGGCAVPLEWWLIERRPCRRTSA